MTWTARPRQALSSFITFARSEAAALAALSLVAAAILAFIGIADEMAEGDTRSVDMAILSALQPTPGQPIGPAWLDHAAQDFTGLGSVSILLTITILTAGFLALTKKYSEAGLLALAFAGGLAISQALKDYFDRQRPPDEYRVVDALNASFPSGHALLAAVVYLTLGAMLARAAKQKQIRFYVMAAAILLALLVGLTRIYLGVHWTSDVLAGWCVGAAWACLCWLVDRWLRTRGNSAPGTHAADEGG
jgi:undecaprenyl-diphosphatase